MTDALSRRLLLAAPFAAVAAPALAHSYRHGDLMIGHAWCLPSEGATSRAMMPLAVTGDRADALIAASTPVAERVAFILRPGGELRIRWDIQPRRPIGMRPDGPHLALIGLNRPLRVKDRVPLTLDFERNGRKVVELWVETAPYSG